MDEDLNLDARRLVDLARQARTPGEGDKSRIAQRLAVPLAAAGTTAAFAKTAAGSQIASGAGAKVAGGTLLGSVGAKIAALITVGAVGTAVVVSNLSTPKVETPAPAPVAVPAVPQVVSEPVPEPEPAAEEPAPEAPVVSTPRVQPKVAPSATHPEHELAQEAALLHQAQAAWRAGQSQRALELANQHAQQFPHSQLANERDVLRVLSLCKLGQVDAAKRVGARLLSKAKGSPWYQSVAGSCAAQ